MNPPLLPSNIEAIVQQLKTDTEFIILSHENPDGDSLGAQFAIALILKGIGKKVQVYSKNPIPKLYDYLPGQQDTIISDKLSIDDRKTLLILDCGDLERPGIDFIPSKPRKIINIDHHITNSNFAHLNWVDRSACATCEMIFYLLPFLEAELTPAVAINLYTGILTDTGSFQHTNTSSRSLKIASRLIDAGADPHAISAAVYDRKTLSALRLMGTVLNKMELYHQQRLAILTVTKRTLKSLHATNEDTEELVTLPQKIEATLISILIKQFNPREYKISLRTKGKVNASHIAEKLGGGGHPNAAGARMKGSLQEIKERLVALAGECLR